MNKKLKISIGVLLLLTISFFGIRLYHQSEMVSLLVLVDEKESPLDSLDIQKLDISLRNRKLAVNFLMHNDESPAIFICTGNGEALYEWLPVQKYFFDHGYSTYIFSYSGFGNSTGKPTATSLIEDASAAYEQFIELTPLASSHIGLSHSLGGTPLLGIANQIEPSFDKLIVHAPYSSLRKLLIDLKMVSPTFKIIWPDLWNNLDYVSSLETPTLFIHSKGDQTVPYYHSETLVEKSNGYGSLVLTEKYGHNAIYKNVSDSLYKPILNFLNR